MEDDKIVKQIRASGWLGNLQIEDTTVITKEMVDTQITYFERAPPCNSWEYASISKTLSDLKHCLQWFPN